MRISRDQYRTLTAVAVLVVAGIAAVVSYLHISDLAITYGQSRLTAYLMPLSVDGLVATSSLAMLRSARARLTTPRLARAGLTLAIMATLGANVASGLSRGPVGAVIAGWPAVAFVISAEIAIGMVRRTPARNTSEVTAEASQKWRSRDMAEAETSIETGIAVTKPGKPGRLAAQELTALTALTADPDMGFDKLSEVLGTSERTARRVRARIADRLPSVNGAVKERVPA